MAGFEEYGHALASLALWGLMMVALSMISTRGRKPENRCDCGKPKRNYADPAYRRERAFMNAVETSPAFMATTVAAMLSGASPVSVNALASIFLLSRIAMAVVHIRTENQPMRSAMFGIGWLVIILMALLSLWTIFIVA
ncbi:MAPEG family protein [Sulfitobacter sp. JBTF-M27]|uniref:MAPEG family protein n=1 Tax=Sulfitobacter sediminilitoris TaxID=2698830 RepID=A0A6P0C7A3_9RHOB|nr:MAPEG family protein [Sulfitobacter sediminilitoris]NEK21026.1 MAPEG family protein [Sulfitobacter sediminilitoris]